MSIAISKAVGHIKRQLPDAGVSSVGATLFVRGASQKSLDALDGDEVAGRILDVDNDNEHTDAAVVKLHR